MASISIFSSPSSDGVSAPAFSVSARNTSSRLRFSAQAPAPCSRPASASGHGGAAVGGLRAFGGKGDLTVRALSSSTLQMPGTLRLQRPQRSRGSPCAVARRRLPGFRVSASSSGAPTATRPLGEDKHLVHTACTSLRMWLDRMTVCVLPSSRMSRGSR